VGGFGGGWGVGGGWGEVGGGGVGWGWGRGEGAIQPGCKHKGPASCRSPPPTNNNKGRSTKNKKSRYKLTSGSHSTQAYKTSYHMRQRPDERTRNPRDEGLAPMEKKKTKPEKKARN